MRRLEGKRTLITGGAAGIGAASAKLFAQQGAKVAVVDINGDWGEKVVASIADEGGEAIFFNCDITKPEMVENTVESVVRRFGGLDVLYNNAGGATPRDGSVLDIPLDEFWRTINVDLYGTFLMCRFAIPQIRDSGGGSVINSTSIRAMRGTRGADAYTAAKGGVLTLTRALAMQCPPMKIRVNAIAPGAVLTERTRAMGMTGDDDGTNPERPVRTGKPIEIAQTALFLASDESSLINGAIIPADSGSSAF